MAIDLSNIGPGSTTPQETNAQKAERRRRLADATMRPVAGPGASGLGIGGNVGLQYKPHNVFKGSTPMPSTTFSPPQASYGERAFANIDTMLFKDRLAPVRKFIDSKAAAFNLKPNDIYGMINAGFITYGKGRDMKYPSLTSSATLPALNELLRTNYVQRDGKYVRVNKDLKVTPNTASYLAYGGLSDDTQGAIDRINNGQVIRRGTSPALDYTGLPSIGKGDNKGINYGKMADSYAKDQKQSDLWKSKITSKIAKEGGSALWSKIMSGKYTPEDVQNLRQYMYSPNGEYGNAQEKFIQESLLRNDGSNPINLLNERTSTTLQALMKRNREGSPEEQKAWAAEQKQRAVDTADMVKAHFGSDLSTSEQFDNLILQINGGQGEYIPNSVIDSIMSSGAGSYINDNSVTGGKRFVPSPLNGFSEAQKASLIDAVVAAQDKGYAIPAGLASYIDPIYTSLTDADKAKYQIPADNSGGSFNLLNAIYGLTGQGDNTSVVGVKPDSFLGTVSGAANLSLMAQQAAASSSFLAPTQDPNATEWLGNWLKSPARAGVGLMPGMFYLATDSGTTSKAVLSDYWHTYSSWDGFTAKVANDPLAPVLDVLSLVDGAGIAIRGAQIAAGAAKLSKASKLGVFPTDTGLFHGPIQPGHEWQLLDPTYNPAIKSIIPEVGYANPATGIGISRGDYASLMRKVALGDQAAKAHLESLLPKGTNGSNSLMQPTFMDNAAAFFEPRYKFITRDDGNKVVIDNARRAAVQDVIEGTTIRFSGNPLVRARQRALFTAQSRGGKVSGLIANLPLLGFNYRFDKAMNSSHLSEAEAVRRELGMLNLYHKAIDDMKLTDIEQQVIMDHVGGGGYTPAVYTAIIRDKLAREAKGMNAETKEFLQAELDRFNNPEFLDEYARTEAHLAEGVSPRGIELSRARNTMLMLLEKQNRLLSAFDSPANIQAALTAYSPLTTAANLNPEHIMRELGKNGSNLAMFNPNWHFAEQMKVYAEDFVFENGQFKRLSPADSEHQALLAQMSKDMEYIRQDHSFRNLGGHPFFIVDEVIKGADGLPMLIRGRRLRLDGKRLEDYSLERAPLIDETPLVIPASALVPKKKSAGVRTLSRDQAASQLHIGAVNALNKIFPNVRDFTDKISPTSVNSAETFKQMENRGIVVASGIQDYHLDIQFKAHTAYLNRRVTDSWQRFFDTTAIPVRVGDFDSKTMIATRTAKLFEDKAAAESYAANYSSVGAVEKGTVTKVMVNGKTMYKTGLRYFDVMKAAVLERRTKVLRNTNDFEKDYLARIEDIQNLDRNEIIMAIPRPTWNKFKASQEAVDAAIKDVFFPTTRKAGNLFNTIFKLGALSLNPHFLSQSVVGSTTMTALGAPELMPSMMASMLQHVARKSGEGFRRASETPGVYRNARENGANRRDALVAAEHKLTTEERDVWSNHVDDFEYMTRSMPHDFENVYQRDTSDGFLAKMGDSRLARWTVYNGYTMVFAFESNMRVAMMRAAALNYPGFKSLMKSRMVRDRAAKGSPELGLETLSPFQAAFEMIRDPASSLHDPNFLHTVSHTADGVLGNYRDFSFTEKAVRNYLLPFYAWQRHSALFTKRMVEERPLAANAAYALGNYGFDRTLAAGGVPDWLYESVPMPDELRKILSLNPMASNRLNLGSISPVSTTTGAFNAVSSLFAGQGVVPSMKTVFDYTNPLISNFVSQTTGIDPRTGIPLTAEEKQKGFLERTLGTFEGFPAIALVANAFKSYDSMNARRGMDSPDDIFVRPEDPNSKLSIPKDKLMERYDTFSAAGLFNAVSPVRAMSLNSTQLVANYRKQMSDKGMSVDVPEVDKTRLEGYTASLLRWKRNADFIKQYWMPVWGKDEVWRKRVEDQLAKEYPKIPANFPKELFNQIMGGAG